MQTNSYSGPKKSLVAHAFVLICAISSSGFLSGCDGGTHLKGVEPVAKTQETPRSPFSLSIVPGIGGITMAKNNPMSSTLLLRMFLKDHSPSGRIGTVGGIKQFRSSWQRQTERSLYFLRDLKPLWMARVDDFLTDRDTLAVADLGNRKTHKANHNAQELAEILAGFRTARLRLVEHLGTFEPDVFARTSLHPRLKQPMRLVDHLYFVAEHDDHHLAKISELIDTHFPKG